MEFLTQPMIWSFSRLNSFYHCPYEWSLKYIDGEYGVSSAMAEFGSYVHKILEMYFKGELSIFELPIYYEENYTDNVTLPFPRNNYIDLASKYYQQGLDYFENFSWDLSGYDVLGVEKKVEFEYSGRNFIGFIDLLLRDKSDGKLVIVDHKSSTLKILKSGKIGKGDQEHFKEFCLQLLMYSHPIIQEYGLESVKTLRWNLFRLGTFYEVPWVKEQYEEAMQWALDTISLIEHESAFQPKPSQFYCWNLCSARCG